MASTRTDLNSNNSQSSYLILAIILVILSLIGSYRLYTYWTQSPPPVPNDEIQSPITPTLVPSENTIIPTPSIIPPISSIPVTATPSSRPTSTVRPTLTITPTVTKSISSTPTPSPTVLNFSSTADKFSVTYQSYRKLYPDTESTGNRYTFYSSKGNIAVHVGTKWSWTHPERLLNPTFIYETSDQKLVDLESGSLKYTIQCVHNGIATLKTECDQFVADFKML